MIAALPIPLSPRAKEHPWGWPKVACERLLTMFPLLIKAVKAEGLKPPEKAILIQIADLTNQLKGKQAWPSEEYLATKTGFGKKNGQQGERRAS